MTIPIKIIKGEEFVGKFRKVSQEDIWDSIASTWSEYRDKTLDIVTEFLKEKSGKVIDLGCGSGRNLVNGMGLEFYCVDISSCQLGLAMTRAFELGVSCRVFKMSADKLSRKDFKEGMFDYGLFIAALHCIEGKENRIRSLAELFRVLKKGGEALITVWKSSDKRFDKVGNSGDVYMSWRVDNEEYYRYYYLFKKKELISLLRDAGFKIIKIYNNKDDRFFRKNWIVKVKK